MAMSELDQCLQDRIMAHTPVTTPPFEALQRRRRSRDRCRSLTAAVVSVVAVTGVAITSVLSEPQDLLTTAAGPSSNLASQASPAVTERAAIRPPTKIRMQARLTGKLRADPATGCLWVEPEDGGRPTEVLLQGGSRYRVDFSTAPTTVLDGETILAKVGDVVELGGGFTGQPGSGVVDCPMASGQPFLGYFSNRPWPTE